MSEVNTPGWHRGDWMQTWTGRRFYPASPEAADVDIRDIAHSLGMLCRYAGHVDRFYSVAEHCVKMSQAIDPEHALEALLHDATEAYVVDVPRPLKVQLPDYQAIERKVQLAVWDAFGLPVVVVPIQTSSRVVERRDPVESAVVKMFDTRILLDERAALMSATREAWGVDSYEPLGVEIEGWHPARAGAEYLARFHELTDSVKL
jgi:5'-deoxynucleotidase YfbR-like HD superfamily hydrolase